MSDIRPCSGSSLNSSSYPKYNRSQVYQIFDLEDNTQQTLIFLSTYLCYLMLFTLDISNYEF